MSEETWRYLLTVEGRPVELSDGEATFGRSRTSTIRLDHESVSRSHALLTLHRGEVTIRDLNSSNGTWVAGRRIVGEMSFPDGGRVQLGAAVVELKIVAPAVPAEKTALLDSSTQPPAAEPAPADPRTETEAPAPEVPPRADPAAPTLPPFTASNLFTDIDRQAREAAGGHAIHEDLFPAGAPRLPEPPPVESLSGPASAAEVPLQIGGTAAPPVPPPVVRVDEQRGAAPGAEGERAGSLFARLAAVLVDSVIATAMNLVLLSPVLLVYYFRPAFRSGPLETDDVFRGILVLCLVLIFVANFFYTVGLWALRGRTPGKALLGLAIVRGEGRPGDGIGWGAAIVRWIVMGLGSIPVGLGWWIAAFRKDRRAWHDLAAGTRVVRKR